MAERWAPARPRPNCPRRSAPSWWRTRRSTISSAREAADYVCQQPGGNGALREFAELIIEAQLHPLPEQESTESRTRIEEAETNV